MSYLYVINHDIVDECELVCVIESDYPLDVDKVREEIVGRLKKNIRPTLNMSKFVNVDEIVWHLKELGYKVRSADLALFGFYVKSEWQKGDV